METGIKDIEEKFLAHLQEEAANWVEEELSVRMVHAKKAIVEQINFSLDEIGPALAMEHMNKAVAFAEEQIRMDLELEAQNRIEEKLRKRRAAVKDGS